MMSSSLKFAFRAILCFVVFSTSNQSAPGYVFEHNGYDYKFVFPEDDQRTWYEAETLCKSEQNGHLASLVTAAEISWADSVIKNVQEGVSSKVRLWIGGSDRQISDVWHFIDDKPLHYNQVPWAPGQPFRPKRVYYEFCISLEFNGERSTWYVEDCFKAHGYICKSLDPPRRLTDQKLFGYSWEWGRNVYKFIPLPWDALSWTEAEVYCREMEGGHLLSIRTRKESRWVTDRIRQIRRVLGFSRFWMGASDFGHQGEYKWSDKNRPVTFTKWKSGEPSSFSNNRKEDCVAILADPDWGKWSDESCVMETPFACKTRVCMGKTDLAFIIDSSGSVGEDNFVEAKNFIWAVARNFDISNRNTRLAILRFSTRAHVIFDFKFSANNNVQRLKEMVDNIEYVEGGTKTERALQLAYTDLFSDKGGSRPDVPRILILMTDGKSERALAVAERSTALKRDKKVTIVAVGIGEEVDMEELFSMASSTEDAINVSSFKELKKRVGNIRDKVCDEIIENQNKRDIEEEERNQQGRTTR